jgi:hypothetical protein
MLKLGGKFYQNSSQKCLLASRIFGGIGASLQILGPPEADLRYENRPPPNLSRRSQFFHVSKSESGTKILFLRWFLI